MKHLLYHVMPTRGKGVWQLNLDRLMPRLGLFDGIRSIAVVRDPACDPPEAVQAYLQGQRVDNWIIEDNDAGLREVKTWGPLWQTLEHAAGFVFYAQAKGVTRPVNASTTIHRWARLLYAANLDYWPTVEKMLARYPIVGACKKVGRCFEGYRSTWHYSGSFFWARLEEALPRVGEMDRWWGGVETWPGRHFSPAQAGCIGGVQGTTTLDCYDPICFQGIEKTFRRWAEARA